MGITIELPINVGDYVYCLSRLTNDKRFLPFINKHRITAISVNIGKRKGRTIKYYYEGEIGTYSIDEKEIGDTVFLTREDAEKMLEVQK